MVDPGRFVKHQRVLEPRNVVLQIRDPLCFAVTSAESYKTAKIG